jgi:predicted DNA-binding protein YlxM (UPF0122 family)
MEQELALVTMYQYYLANKQALPSNIVTQRDFILNELVEGKHVQAVFDVAVKKAIEATPIRWKQQKTRKVQVNA